MQAQSEVRAQQVHLAACQGRVRASGLLNALNETGALWYILLEFLIRGRQNSLGPCGSCWAQWTRKKAHVFVKVAARKPSKFK